MRVKCKPFFFPCLFLAVLCALSSRAEPRILIVGDSWAQGIVVAGLMDIALAETGFQDYQSVGANTALGGSRADQWVRPDYRAKITRALTENPTVDMIHLVIGGNDVLGHIKDCNIVEAWTDERRRGAWDAVARNIKHIVAHCLAHPQVRHVGLAGYDYLNSTTANEVFALLGQRFDFGGMTQAQVNECFIELERRKRDLALATAGCTYIHNFGLLQHHYNVPPDVPRPGGPPNYTPFPGGDPARPMPDAAFVTVTFENREYPGDGIHPSDEAHLLMLRNAMGSCYADLLTEEQPGSGCRNKLPHFLTGIRAYK